MAINFPNSPVDGQSYDFGGIRYTYKDTGGGTGYWAVLTPGTVGIATINDIDLGTEPVKYITPQGLEGSKYNKIIEPGTVMLFIQPSAPLGWTKSTSHNNKALRIVSGSGGGSGGTVDFSSAFTSVPVSGSISSTIAGGTVSVGGHTLSTAQTPNIYVDRVRITSSHGSITNTLTVGTSSGSEYGRVALDAHSASGSWGLSFRNGSTAANSHNHSGSFSGNSHGHSFTGNNLNLAVKYVDSIICVKD